MKELQTRLEVQVAAQNWAATMMQQYGISAAVIEDALTKVLLSLKDIVTQELVQEIAAKEAPIQEEGNSDGESDN